MTFKKVLLASIVTSMFAAGAAYAGPPVTVTFKNLGNETATYKVITNNEVSTNASASPKPATTVPAKGSDIYRVQNVISPDANAAIVRYTMGSKTCVFGTTFVNTIIPGGLFNPGGPKRRQNGINQLREAVGLSVLQRLLRRVYPHMRGMLNSQ
nr:hypothetical protein KXZ65_08580 [Pectobacterium sp. PL152]